MHYFMDKGNGEYWVLIVFQVIFSEQRVILNMLTRNLIAIWKIGFMAEIRNKRLEMSWEDNLFTNFMSKNH